ncbi:MAG: beta-ketoacyl-[Alistipes sp.]|nr:beta-ketoacyl-[acyl-carrier-protein] synthase II [Alistipes sp.]
MDKRVVITGMGVVTPIGNNITEFWQHLKEGVCGIRPIEGIEEDIPIHVAGQVRDFDPIAQGLTSADVRRSDRYSQFAVAASIQAMAQSGLVAGENIAPERLGVYIGSGIGGMQTFVDQTKVLVNEGARRISPLFIPMMIANIAAGNVAIRFHAQGVCLPVVSACATSTHAAGEAFRAIKHGYADAILTGGSEAAVHALAIGGFANSKALSTTTNPAEASIPFDRRRNGFVMAEGAGVLLFEELEHARKRGATMLAEVVGYGNSCDAYHYTAPRPDGAAA